MLLVAPDFQCATGLTPSLVATHGRRFRYRLFAARDLRFRRRAFRRLLDGADLVHWHANLAHFPHLAAEAERRTDLVRVATVHHLDDGDDDVLDAALAHADHLHVPDELGADELRRRGADRPSLVVPYVLAPPPSGIRDVDPSRTRVVGWCGSSTGPDDRKRLRTLIDALALLADRHLVLSLQGFVDPSIPAAAEAAGVTLQVTGARPWARRWEAYAGIDVYCSPSTVEGGPLPVFEAAASGVPVVTTRVGMAATLVDGGGAWEGSSDDPQRLADALVAVADADTTERAVRLARAAEITRGFGAEHGVPRYEALYAGLLGVDPSSGRPSLQPRTAIARGRLEPVVRRARTERIRIHRWRKGPGSSPYED